MRKNRPADRTNANSWLESALLHRGLTKQEFADAVGVSRSTVYRWLEGDRPKGELIDKISDVLLEDYKVVWARMGYADAATMEIDPNSPTARLMPLIEKVDWESDPERLEKMEMDLRWMIDRDREAKTGKE